MVKTEVMDPELREIGWSKFKCSWCTGYYPCRYRNGIYLLIHKNINDIRPNHLSPILLFDIKVNLHNEYLVKLTTKKAEQINSLALKQYGSIKAKAMDIQALNTRLFFTTWPD